MGGLLDTSPIVSYSLSISKLDVLEAHLSGGSLESWVENVRFKPFAPEREAGNQEFPPVRHSTEREVGGESVFPVHFKVGFFSFSWCVSISQCFWISFRGNCSLVAVDLVIPWRWVQESLTWPPWTRIWNYYWHSGMGGNGWWGSENAIRTEKERDSHISGGSHLAIWNKGFYMHSHSHTHTHPLLQQNCHRISLLHSHSLRSKVGPHYINWLISLASSVSDLHKFTKILPVFPWESGVSYPRVPWAQWPLHGTQRASAFSPTAAPQPCRQ